MRPWPSWVTSWLVIELEQYNLLEFSYLRIGFTGTVEPIMSGSSKSARLSFLVQLYASFEGASKSWTKVFLHTVSVDNAGKEPILSCFSQWGNVVSWLHCGGPCLASGHGFGGGEKVGAHNSRDFPLFNFSANLMLLPILESTSGSLHW